MEKENNNTKLTLENEMFKINNGLLAHIKKYEKKIVIPEGVESIFTHLTEGMSSEEKSNMRREGKAIEEIVFPSTLKEIYPNAFSQKYGQHYLFDLKNVKIPPSVEYIGANAFADNNNLETLEIHENIKLDSYPFVLDREYITPNPMLPTIIRPTKSTVFVTNLPSKIIINYTSFSKLSKCLDELINSKNFKFDLTYVPKFEFELKGPELSKIETLKIYRKIILTRARKATFTNQQMRFDLTDYQQTNELAEQKEGKSK